MRKLLGCFLVALGLMATSAMAGSGNQFLETVKHNIKLTCDTDSNACTYQAWNKPRLVGQGRPDIQLRGEKQPWKCYVSEGNIYPALLYAFMSGDMAIKISDRCTADGKFNGKADGQLWVEVNGKVKSRYWITDWK